MCLVFISVCTFCLLVYFSVQRVQMWARVSVLAYMSVCVCVWERCVTSRQIVPRRRCAVWHATLVVRTAMLVTMTAVVVREPLQQLMTVGTGNAATFHVFLLLNLEFLLLHIISSGLVVGLEQVSCSHFTPALRSGLKHHSGFICMTPLAPNGSEGAGSDSCFLEHYLSLFLYNLLPPWW